LVDQYGPIFGLGIADGAHVVVSTENIANDLIHKRGALYSSRKPFLMAA
jgi:hypothetical protein